MLSSVFSFSTLFIFMLMAVALLVRGYYVTDITPKRGLYKFLVCLFLICSSSTGLTVIWNLNNRSWIGYVVCAVFWFIGTLAMQLLAKQRVPKIWEVPLVPWLPSLSIGMNIFLIGSLGYQAFVRFFICSAIMLLYYVFVGVHATYDVAHHEVKERKIEEAKEDNNQGRL